VARCGASSSVVSRRTNGFLRQSAATRNAATAGQLTACAQVLSDERNASFGCSPVLVPRGRNQQRLVAGLHQVRDRERHRERARARDDDGLRRRIEEHVAQPFEGALKALHEDRGEVPAL